MTVIGPDVSSNQTHFDFNLAFQQGCRATYIKLGGDNIPEYVSGSYAGRVDAARAAGLRVGHYWITGGHNPEASARFFAANLRNVQPGDFFVLDNERLDSGNFYSDDEAARWIRTVQSLVGGDPRRLFMYCSQSPLSAQPWTATRATGAQALVAWYGRQPLSFASIGSWPAEQIGGHQYADNGNVGGWPDTDMNAWKDSALNFGNTPITPSKGTTMYLIWTTTGTGWLFIPGKGLYGLNNMQQYTLFERVIKSNQTSDRPDTFLPQEIDIMNAVLNQVPYNHVPERVAATVDLTAIQKGITDSVTAAVAGIAGHIDTATLGNLVAAALAPHFDAIPGAVLDAEAKRLDS